MPYLRLAGLRIMSSYIVSQIRALLLSPIDFASSFPAIFPIQRMPYIVVLLDSVDGFRSFYLLYLTNLISYSNRGPYCRVW